MRESLREKLLLEKKNIQQKEILTVEDEKVLDRINLMFDELEENPKMFFEDRQFIPKLLADYIMKDNIFKTLVGSDEMFYYKDGIYKSNGKELIKSVAVKLLGKMCKMHYLHETIGYIQALTYVDPDSVNNEWMNLENGLLNPITGEFVSHNPSVFSIIRIPIVYDPKAECPLWTKALSERVDEKTMMTVQEMFGYCFQPEQRYEKAFILYGQKRTFKSTTLFILEKIIGRENITAFSLQQLNDDVFAAAYLYGKAANICGDISSSALRDTGQFLKITGGDPITASKKQQHHITFYPSAKLIFSCNVIPATRNKNPAFYRRWIILEFSKQMDVKDVDPQFKEKLKDELSGILNWSLEGLKRLVEKKKFSYALTEDEVKDLYERSSDTIQSFIYNCIDTENDLSVLTKKETVKAYKKYCKGNKLQPENPIKFGRMFIGLTGCGTCKKGARGESIPAYQGVGWKKIVETHKKKNMTNYIEENNNTENNVI